MFILRYIITIRGPVRLMGTVLKRKRSSYSVVYSPGGTKQLVDTVIQVRRKNKKSRKTNSYN